MTIHKTVTEFKPATVIVDPITNLLAIGDDFEVKAMLTRLIDFLKIQGVTAVFTSLTSGGSIAEQSEVGVSSLMDTWLLLRNIESGGERNRLMFILKSRGMAHSNQVREFLLTDTGIHFKDPYIGSGVVLTGSARMVQEAQDQAQDCRRAAGDCPSPAASSSRSSRSPGPNWRPCSSRPPPWRKISK